MAPGPCCVSGVASPESATGTEEKIHGLNTYVAKPKGTPTGLVVIIADAFGWDFINLRVMADKFSKRGFLVYLPDFMNGPPVNPNAILQMDKIMAPSSFLYKILIKPLLILRLLPMFALFLYRNTASKTMPTVTQFFASLRCTPETKYLRIGAAGYCWGGKHTVLLTHGPNPLIDAGFTAHPSNLSVPGDIEGRKRRCTCVLGMWIRRWGLGR